MRARTTSDHAAGRMSCAYHRVLAAQADGISRGRGLRIASARAAGHEFHQSQRRAQITSSLIVMGILREKHEGLTRGNSDPNAG